MRNIKYIFSLMNSLFNIKYLLAMERALSKANWSDDDCGPGSSTADCDGTGRKQLTRSWSPTAESGQSLTRPYSNHRQWQVHVLTSTTPEQKRPSSNGQKRPRALQPRITSTRIPGGNRSQPPGSFSTTRPEQPHPGKSPNLDSIASSAALSPQSPLWIARSPGRKQEPVLR